MPGQTQKRTLLVEGINDLYVVANLWESNGLPKRYFEIVECGSDVKLIQNLKALLSASEEERPEKLGVILDADIKNASARWDAIKHVLTTGDYASFAAKALNANNSEAKVFIEFLKKLFLN